MGKRKNKKEDEEYIRKKIQKLEKKLELRSRTKNLSLTPSTSPTPVSVPSSPSLQTVQNEAETEQEPKTPELNTDEDPLPEEFLLALGNEGEEKTVVGKPICAELALRWTRIMSSGLEKQARDHILQKYSTPSNFLSAKAPVLNPELKASISDLSLKRDNRISYRQNVTGKVMTCLGQSLTSILKGNINSKILIEEINDAAKLTAEIFYQDSSSRKFFALAGVNQTVKKAVNSSKTDEFLFGKDCAEKIKNAQTIHKTGSQIKSDNSVASTKKKVTKQGNWKGPPRPQYKQYQHQHQARGGLRQRQQQQNYQHHKDQKYQPTNFKNKYRR